MPRLIDADALVESFRDKQYELTHFRGGYQFLNDEDKAEYDRLDVIIQQIESAHTVDPVRGRWIHDGVRWACSSCHKGADYWPMATAQHLGEHCPSCGARMDEGGGEVDTNAKK